MGGHSMTLDPPHMVRRFDNLAVNSPYWQQALLQQRLSLGVGPTGVNPYGPDEGTPDITVPFSRREPVIPGGRTSYTWTGTRKVTA